jgi:hypothetical protein
VDRPCTSAGLGHNAPDNDAPAAVAERIATAMAEA